MKRTWEMGDTGKGKATRNKNIKWSEKKSKGRGKNNTDGIGNGMRGNRKKVKK